jgi:hypothetical protein
VGSEHPGASAPRSREIRTGSIETTCRSSRDKVGRFMPAPESAPSATAVTAARIPTWMVTSGQEVDRGAAAGEKQACCFNGEPELLCMMLVF